MSNIEKPKLVDPVTKKNLIMLLYRSVGDGKKVGYGEMHKSAKRFQDLLEKKYGLTLGYRFQDPSIFDVWDDNFQEDIERYDAVCHVLDNADILVPNTKGYYTHDLKLRRPEGEFLLRSVSKDDLEKRLGIKLDRLVEEVRSSVAR